MVMPLVAHVHVGGGDVGLGLKNAFDCAHVQLGDLAAGFHGGFGGLGEHVDELLLHDVSFFQWLNWIRVTFVQCTMLRCSISRPGNHVKQILCIAQYFYEVD
jgi:hypothetical protein